MDDYKNPQWLREQIETKRRTYVDIGKQFGKDHTTIYYWAKKFGIKPLQKAKQEFICPVCKKPFVKAIYKERQTTYCSQPCAYRGRTLGTTKRKVKRPYNIKKKATKITKVCVWCGKMFDVFKTNKSQKFCSKECVWKRLSETMRGENNPAWVDGSSYTRRCHRGHDWDKKRKKCYARDEYTCQVCGVRCVGRRALNESNGHRLIQAHHIVPYKATQDNSPNNLITLCASCHTKVHEGTMEPEITKARLANKDELDV